MGSRQFLGQESAVADRGLGMDPTEPPDLCDHSFGKWLDEERPTTTFFLFQTWEAKGRYRAPLPPPSERRRIREIAGWTQDQIADEVGVSRDAVRHYERRAGYDPETGHHYPGREPQDEIRDAYSALLTRLMAQNQA